MTARAASRLRARLLAMFGGKCKHCPATTGLEFAHIWPTGLSGLGRGRQARLYDVLKHPACYLLLCRSCHLSFDSSKSVGPSLPVSHRM